MQVLDHVSLRPYNTFGIDVKAQKFAEFATEEDLQWLQEQQVFDTKHMVLGGGSNLLLTQDFDGWVLKNSLRGRKVITQSDRTITIRLAAGENWHESVLWCVENGYGGIENLSLIPGTVGAAPMQNIGAYGVEIKDLFAQLTAFNKSTGAIEVFDKEACQFGYRESVFKNELKNKFIILSMDLSLTLSHHNLHLSYGAIQSVLEEKGIKEPSLKDISAAVIQIRQSKLPDPKEIGNSGSFFKNPIVEEDFAEALKMAFPDLPCYPTGQERTKLAAGWLIEQCGWKGKRVGATGAHEKQALVLVNYGDATGSEVWHLALQIQKSVKQRFGVTLQPEVNIM